MKRNQDEPSRHIVDILFVLALFGVFAASALMLVTLGANVYKQNVANMSGNFTKRTAYSYLTEKLRQNDTSDAVSIGELEGTQALVLSQSLNDIEYVTYLYLSDGYLKELYMRKDSFTGTNLLSAGQSIMPLTCFEIEKESPRLIKLTLDTGDQEPITIYTALHSDYH